MKGTKTNKPQMLDLLVERLAEELWEGSKGRVQAHNQASVHPLMAASYLSCRVQKVPISNLGLAERVWEKFRATHAPREVARIRAALNSKGRPETAYRGRYLHVLASLIAHDFRDIAGNKLRWKTQQQLDHIIPMTSGGSDTPDNWQWLASEVNQVKSNKTQEEFEEALYRLSQVPPEQYEVLYQSKKVKYLNKAVRGQALKLELDSLSPDQKLEKLERLKVKELQLLLKQQKLPGKTHRVVRKPHDRFRQYYPKRDGLIALLKVSWGLPISPEPILEILRTNQVPFNTSEIQGLLQNFTKGGEWYIHQVYNHGREKGYSNINTEVCAN